MGFALRSFCEHELKGRRMARTQLALTRKLKAPLDLHKSRQEAAHAKVPARRLRQG
jgi:hypothetical protein